MTTKFRSSEFVDFNTGSVKVTPLELQFKMTMAGKQRFPDLVRLFQCRIEVWQLGVAAQLVRHIELYTPPSNWSHAAYGLLMILVTYFETIGKLLNPEGVPAITTETDFDYGFRDVYADITTSSGKAYDPREFYRRIRHGLYALGTTRTGLWVHNDKHLSTKDFDLIQKNPEDAATLKYYINPHAVVRTLIDHFPTFIARLNDPDACHDALRERFRAFVGELGER